MSASTFPAFKAIASDSEVFFSIVLKRSAAWICRQHVLGNMQVYVGYQRITLFEDGLVENKKARANPFTVSVNKRLGRFHMRRGFTVNGPEHNGQSFAPRLILLSLRVCSRLEFVHLQIG